MKKYKKVGMFKEFDGEKSRMIAYTTDKTWGDMGKEIKRKVTKLGSAIQTIIDYEFGRSIILDTESSGIGAGTVVTLKTSNKVNDGRK
jgi:hypothetical protein